MPRSSLIWEKPAKIIILWYTLQKDKACIVNIPPDGELFESKTHVPIFLTSGLPTPKLPPHPHPLHPTLPPGHQDRNLYIGDVQTWLLDWLDSTVPDNNCWLPSPA